MNEDLKKRLIALVWHSGAMAGVVFLTSILDPQVLNSIGIPQYAVILLGLIGAQVTKHLNQA